MTAVFFHDVPVSDEDREKICVEITTFRADGNYSDGRRPDEVTFSDNIEDDLARRDFTMNAMAIRLVDFLLWESSDDSLKSKLIDPYDGCKALTVDKTIKCVGKPVERFNEDALRIMRGIRFAAAMDFDIDKETQKAMYECGVNLKNVSEERKRDELVKTLLSLPTLQKENPQYFNIRRMVEWAIKRIIPEFLELSQVTHNNPYHYADIFTHTMDCLFAIEKPDIELLLAVLFHDIGKLKCRHFDENRLTNHYYGHPVVSVEMTKEIMERMRFDNDTIKNVLLLVETHDSVLQGKDRTVKKLLNKIGYDLCMTLIELQWVDKGAHRYSGDDFAKKMNDIVAFSDRCKEIIEAGEAFKIADLAINGDDLLSIGFAQGKELGDALEKCLEHVIDNPQDNERGKLLEIAKNVLKEIQS
jgi:tRNA nucleotidyltransferase (CCA-adding enzyme)